MTIIQKRGSFCYSYGCVCVFCVCVCGGGGWGGGGEKTSFKHFICSEWIQYTGDPKKGCGLIHAGKYRNVINGNLLSSQYQVDLHIFEIC